MPHSRIFRPPHLGRPWRLAKATEGVRARKAALGSEPLASETPVQASVASPGLAGIRPLGVRVGV